MKNQNLITILNRCFSSWPSILGRDGPMSNAYRLAIQYINESRPITAVEVNKVLAFSGISISQDMLNKILSRPRLDFSDLDSSTIKTEKFLQTIGTVIHPFVYLLMVYQVYFILASLLLHDLDYCLTTYWYNLSETVPG